MKSLKLLSSAIEDLYAGIHPQHFGFYRMLAQRFPYAIYYLLKNKNVVLVYRILDMRQDPNRIRESLK